jgi:NADH dehydrogenase
MGKQLKHAVTGAFGFSGKYIAQALLAYGDQVITLTNHTDRPDPFDGKVRAFPIDFNDQPALLKHLEGIDTLFNTYWIRFERNKQTFDKAVANAKKLFTVAHEAGVRRIVHLSVSNPYANKDLPYFQWKAQLEDFLIGSGFSYTILRPTLIYGVGDILINNIAWLLRRFPIFTIPGKGDYQVQPISVEDLAELAVEASLIDKNAIWDTAGPEILTFSELVDTICETLSCRAKLLKVSPRLVLILIKLVSILVGDVVLTQDELIGLRDNLLVAGLPGKGKTPINKWLAKNREVVGIEYHSELSRHFKE